jgi:hypothetical protein
MVAQAVAAVAAEDVEAAATSLRRGFLGMWSTRRSSRQSVSLSGWPSPGFLVGDVRFDPVGMLIGCFLNLAAFVEARTGPSGPLPLS